MKISKAALIFISLIIFSCNPDRNKKIESQSVLSIGAMKNVMWKGELNGVVSLDTLENKKNLYGLGPAEYLMGELLVIDGESYKSTVVTDSTMKVRSTTRVKPPFFVYSYVENWEREALPRNIKTLDDLESYMNSKFEERSEPFTFKIKGQAQQASIHIQNLPKGSKVSSPKEAHQGQTSYNIKSKEVEIVGFYSKNHSGVYTHHDTNMHMHLITKDRLQMGHLDSILFSEGMELYYSK